MLTHRLRELAAALWCLGLGLLAYDFLSLPVLRWRASVAYVAFGFAFAVVSWAEKREFGTRIYLYRLHDALILSPWRFLLLYFLWISVFSPFTVDPFASLVYAANGWISLITVGIGAQFIFCERALTVSTLEPDRLRWAFLVYSVAVAMLLAGSLWGLFGGALWFRPAEQANLFFFFSIGFPFLLWDFAKQGRRLTPRWMSAATIFLGIVLLLLIGRRSYLASLLFSVGGVLGLFLYKRIRPHRALLWAAVAVASSVAAAALLALALGSQIAWSEALERARHGLAVRMLPPWDGALEALRGSSFMGKGLGVTGIRGVWARVAAEAGVVGLALYSAFFVSLLWELYRVRRVGRVVVSNVALVSLCVFLLFLSHYVENPYSAFVWVWYSIWALFASTSKKKRIS